MQTLLGYTAQEAGLALMPGGFAIMLCMPRGGIFARRVWTRGIWCSFGLLHAVVLAVPYDEFQFGRSIFTPS